MRWTVGIPERRIGGVIDPMSRILYYGTVTDPTSVVGGGETSSIVVENNKLPVVPVNEPVPAVNRKSCLINDQAG